MLLAITVAGVACLDTSGIIQPELAIVPGVPAGWSSTSTVGGIGVTTTDVKSGAAAAYLSSAGQINSPSYVLAQYIRANHYRGERVQLTAWVKPRNVSNFVLSGVWMRIDGPTTYLGFDNMANRVVRGTGDWRQVSVVLDVPAEAIGIAFGANFRASNTLLVDEMSLTIVANTVPTTNTLTATALSGMDSASTVASYLAAPDEPVNMGFETPSVVARSKHRRN